MKKYTFLACLLFAVSAAAQQPVQPVKAGGFTYSLMQAHFGEVPAFFRGQAGLVRTKSRNERGDVLTGYRREYQVKAGGFFGDQGLGGAQFEFTQRQDLTAAVSYINCDLRRRCESDWFGFWNIGPAIRFDQVAGQKIYGGITAGFTAASDHTALQVAATWTQKWDIQATVTQQVQKYCLVDFRYQDRRPSVGISLAVKNFRLRCGADLTGTKSLTLNAAF